MRTAIKETKVYTFDELSQNAKNQARNYFRVNAFDYEWYDFVYEDAQQCGKILGIEIDKIYFSGFSSQGDGACFEGSYKYKKGSTKNIRDHVPFDKDLHSIADTLQTIQKPHFYQLTANIKHSGHYYHELCTNIDVYHADFGEYDRYADKDVDIDICDALRSFMQWIYSQLEKQYDYLNSDKSIDENIKCNEYEFTIDGKIY